MNVTHKHCLVSTNVTDECNGHQANSIRIANVDEMYMSVLMQLGSSPSQLPMSPK